MAKLPYMPFYPNDYIRDTRGLPAFVKGVWMDLICFLWDAKPRGRETLPMTAWSQRCGVSEADMRLALDTLRLQRICDVKFLDEFSVKICSRRMVRDEEKRAQIRARVAKHRESKAQSNVLRNGLVTHDVTPCNGDISEVRSHISEVRSQKKNKKEETSETAGKPAKRTKREKVPLPDGFDLTDQRRYYAASKGVKNPDLEFEHFREHHRKNDTRWADWEAAWRTWVINAVKWGQPSNGSASIVACNWQYRPEGAQASKVCGKPVEPDLVAAGERICREHQESKRKRDEKIRALRGELNAQAQANA